MKKHTIGKRTALCMAAFLSAGLVLAHPLSVSAEENIYCVGSVSKVYVTAAAMHLAEEGKLDIDTPVTEYIPEFTMADERYKEITPRMLMNHTSGLMGTTLPGVFLYNDNNPLHHDTLLEELSKQRLKADPGVYAAYCNDGFDLLELVVERVSGMSYTDYVEQLVAATGCKNTGTPADMIRKENLAPAISPEGIRYDNTMTMCFGAGGIYATASDAAGFGASFFDGDGTILSERSKKEMATRWDTSADDFEDKSGLGWDYVSMPQYEEQGVSVHYKGGDCGMNHAGLLVAPDEKVSVAVLSNGGSSVLNGMLAQELLDVILKDRGISVREEAQPVFETIAQVPESFDRYEGCYAIQNDLGGGATISRVTFPDHRYMHVEDHTATRTTGTDYLPCADGTFVELAFEIENGDLSEAKIAAEPACISFKEKDGTVYLTGKSSEHFPGLGNYERCTYVGQLMEDDPVSEEDLSGWRELAGKDLLLGNDISSSQAYDTAMTRIRLSEEMPGYLYIVTQMGSRVLKIEDATHAVAPLSIPSSINRDLIDLTLEKGRDGARLVASNGLTYRIAEGLPELSGGGTFSFTDREPLWYRIGADKANRTLCIGEMSDGCAVIVYNRYGSVVYSSHEKDAGDELPLPKDGYLLLTGETGGTITLN